MLRFQAVSLIILLLPLVSSKNLDLQLRDFPLLMTHDAATGYYPEDPPAITTDTEVSSKYDFLNLSRWIRTQNTTFTSQLQCGANSFDLRPYCEEDGKLEVYFHHGPAKIKRITLEKGLEEIMNYSRSFTIQSLIVLYFSHLSTRSNNDKSKTDCWSRIEEVLNYREVKMFGCNENSNITSMKVNDIIHNHGSIIAVDESCVDENYDRKVNCEGWNVDNHECLEKPDTKTASKSEECIPLGYTCLSPSQQDDDTSLPFMEFWKYYNNTANNNVTATKSMKMLQTHWQYDLRSISYGMILGTSILNDAEGMSSDYPNLTERVRRRIEADIGNSTVPGKKRQGIGKLGFNIIEVNHICVGGREMATTLGKILETGVADSKSVETLKSSKNEIIFV